MRPSRGDPAVAHRVQPSSVFGIRGFKRTDKNPRMEARQVAPTLTDAEVQRVLAAVDETPQLLSIS